MCLNFCVPSHHTSVFLLDLFWLVCVWFVFVVAMIFFLVQSFFYYFVWSENALRSDCFIYLCNIHFGWYGIYAYGMAQWRLHTYSYTHTSISMLIKFWARIHVPLQLNLIQCIFLFCCCFLRATFCLFLSLSLFNVLLNVSLSAALQRCNSIPMLVDDV